MLKGLMVRVLAIAAFIMLAGCVRQEAPAVDTRVEPVGALAVNLTFDDSWVSLVLQGPGQVALNASFKDCDNNGLIVALQPINFTGDAFDYYQNWTLMNDNFVYYPDGVWFRGFCVPIEIQRSVAIPEGETWTATAGGAGTIDILLRTNATLIETVQGESFSAFRHGTASPLPGVAINVDVYNYTWRLEEPSHLAVQTINDESNDSAFIGFSPPKFYTPYGEEELRVVGRMLSGAFVGGIFGGGNYPIRQADLACSPPGDYSVEQQNEGTMAELRVYALVGVPCGDEGDSAESQGPADQRGSDDADL